MDLRDFLKDHEIEETLTHVRQGKTCVAHPREDCSIADTVDEVAELHKVCGAYYFYGSISAKILEAKENLEVSLAAQKEKLNDSLQVRKSAVYLQKQVELQQANARCTDKVLENLQNSDEQVIAIKGQLNQLSEVKAKIVELNGAENKLKVIMKALLLKQDDLIEISRRKKEELKSIGNLQ
jgi:hypothetical protein